MTRITKIPQGDAQRIAEAALAYVNAHSEYHTEYARLRLGGLPNDYIASSRTDPRVHTLVRLNNVMHERFDDLCVAITGSRRPDYVGRARAAMRRERGGS